MLRALLLVLAGCATMGPAPLPAGMTGEEQAVHIVWSEVYGRTDRPPLVRWRSDAQLDCDHRSGKRGFTVLVNATALDAEPQPACKLGMTWSALEVVIAWHGELSFSETPLAEELEHADLLRRGFYGENAHDRPDFFLRIERANAALVAAGR